MANHRIVFLIRLAYIKEPEFQRNATTVTFERMKAHTLPSKE